MTQIIWKEWKRSRILFVVFLLAAVVIPALPAHLFPDEGATGRMFIRFIWLLFSFSVGWLFGEQNRRGTLPFLLARPATRPFLFCAHYLGYLTMLAILVFFSVSVHYIHMALKLTGFSPLTIVFEPELLFAIAMCVFLFSLSLFIANSIITFGLTPVMVCFLVLLIFLLTPAIIFSDWHMISPYRLRLIRFGEYPITILMIAVCGGIVFGALSLWEICFDEMRDARNRRWTRAVVAASILSLIILGMTICSIYRLRLKSSEVVVNEVFSIFQGNYPLVCALSDGSDEGCLVAISKKPYFVKGKFVKKETDPPPHIRNLHVSGKNFISVPFWQELTFVCFSDKPIFGTEIRRFSRGTSRKYGFKRDEIDLLSPRYYSRKETIGFPFLSPDNDRIAYLRTSRPRFGGKVSQSLWITKFGLHGTSQPVSDRAELPDDAGTGRTPTGWTPIGWTPDGYDFLLAKKGKNGSELWAVDWVARGPRRFLQEFTDVRITEDDLPSKGNRISLVKKEPDGKWTVYIVNYRSGESTRLGIFENEPLRIWGADGICFAFWVSSSGTLSLNVYNHPHDGKTYPRAFHIPSVSQMKISGSAMAVVISDSNSPQAKPRLARLHITGPNECRLETLAEEFSGNRNQWNLHANGTIVYADGAELWQVESDGTRTRILP